MEQTKSRKSLQMMLLALVTMLSFTACGLIDNNVNIKAFSGTFTGQEWPVENGIGVFPEYFITLTFDDSGNYTCERYSTSDEAHPLVGKYSGTATSKKGKLVLEDPYNESFEIAGDINETFELIGSNYIPTGNSSNTFLACAAKSTAPPRG